MAGLIADMEGRTGDDGDTNWRAGAGRMGAAAAVGYDGDVLNAEANGGPGEKVYRIDSRGDDVDVAVGEGAGWNDVPD